MKGTASTNTFLEFVNLRYGYNAHKVLLFALMANTIVTAMLVLGGAAVVNALTSIHTFVDPFLIPIGVIINTFSGGLTATFFADYLNSPLLFVVFVAILIFFTIIYFNKSGIGGISGLFEKLVSFASTNPVDGKVEGAYLTMASTVALDF